MKPATANLTVSRSVQFFFVSLFLLLLFFIFFLLFLRIKLSYFLTEVLIPCRPAAIGVSAGKGIMATHEGLVYMWELSSGTKLCTLQCFKGMLIV